MKRIVLIIFLVPLLSQAQVADWYGSDLSRIGYKKSTLVFENAKNGEAHLWAGNPHKEIKGGSFELSADIFAKHLYFGIDGSWMLDALYDMYAAGRKETWYNNKTWIVDHAEMVPVRLAFGLPITPYASLYAGGQYQYAITGIKYKQSNAPDRELMIRGNQRGIGIHAVAAYKIFHLRYSYMYDWIREKKTFTGHAITNEIALHIGPEILGGFIKLNHCFRVLDGGDFSMDRNKEKLLKNSDATYMIPAEYNTAFTLSFGIYAAGLFSGVSHSVGKSVTEVEKGVRNNKNEKKRRTIKYGDD